MDNIQKIEGNLYGFYTNGSRAASLEYQQEDHYSWVRNPTGSWPNYVFDLNMDMLTDKDFIDEMAGRIKRKEIPPIIVNRLPENAESYYEITRQNGLREIFSWTGMALEKAAFISRANQDTDLSVMKVSGPDQVNYWMDIVNTALFNSKSLSVEITTVLSNMNGMELYLGFVSDVPVCTALSFQQDEVAGLYMIATLPEYRGKGYGTIVTVSAIENCFGAGADTIILHASGMGEKIYRKLGFAEYCNFGILWMVGKEYT
jgi:ribosomal protein S18 acetylase RimI-like enzyme